MHESASFRAQGGLSSSLLYFPFAKTFSWRQGDKFSPAAALGLAYQHTEGREGGREEGGTLETLQPLDN